MPSVFSRAVTTLSSLSLLLLPVCTAGEASGVHREPREFADRELIVGGTPVTDKNKYPYMTRVQYSDFLGSDYCGATLVAPNILLTAAHCGDMHTAQIGRLDSDVQTSLITHKAVHPNYKLIGGYPFNDYMLLKLSTDVTGVPLITLDDGKDKDLTTKGREVVTMGYGATKFGGENTNKLLEVDLDIFPHSTCKTKYHGKVEITDRMICGSSYGGKDACVGDSGGPLLTLDEHGKWIQIGIVSFAAGVCADPEFPGVYAHVSKEYDWIKEKIDNRHSNDGWEEVSCMAGSTRVKTPEGFVRVDELEIGMQVMGVTADGVEDPSCNVVAIGSNGMGAVYGNYTSSHFVLLEDGKTVAEHGEVGELRTDTLFDVLLDCPFGIDEVGTKFSAMANYYTAAKEDTTSVNIGHHFIVYEALLTLVRKTGTFWMSSKSYKNIAGARIKQGEIINLMMECLHSNVDKSPCARFEEAARDFVEEQFPTGAMRRRALSGTNNITNMEEHEDGGVEEATFGDIIHSAFPKLGSPGGESGTVVFALREEVQKSRTSATTIVLSAIAAVAGFAFIATVMIVRRNRRRNDGTPDEHPESSTE